MRGGVESDEGVVVEEWGQGMKESGNRGRRIGGL